MISLVAHQTIITNLDYSTIDNLIQVFLKHFKKSGKIVNLESYLLTDVCWKAVLKNKSREFANFKIYVNDPNNFTLKIKLNFPKVLSEKTKQKLEKEISIILKNGNVLN